MLCACKSCLAVAMSCVQKKLSTKRSTGYKVGKSGIDREHIRFLMAPFAKLVPLQVLSGKSPHHTPG